MPLLNIWDLCMLVGIAQGFVMAMVLWFRKGVHVSSRFLAVIFFALAYSALINFLSEHPPAEINRFHLWVTKYLAIYPVMLLGPSLLFFVQSRIEKGFVLDRSKLNHYWSVLFNLIPTIIGAMAWVFQKFGLPYLSTDQLNAFLTAFFTYGDAVFWSYTLTYVWLTQNYLRLQNSGDFTRLFQVLRAFKLILATWFPFLVIYVSPYQEILSKLGYYPIFIPLTVLIYWLGFQWFFHLYKSASAVKKPAGGYKSVATALQQAMEKGLFLDTDLNVKSASQQLGVPQRTLSECINQHFSQTFTDFVNGYRVEEVKRKLSDPKCDHLTMAAIAHDSGFKSIATFQRVFKHIEGMSPTALKKQLVNT
ncbi:MAG: helix-turn-helix domain-containing protein [Cytophagales bacterium]|nr:helix-turn-helix domain-containing protein [Cytophagales bacterium]